MIWNKNFISSILAAVIFELSITMHASRVSAMKQTDRLAIGTECKCCSKMFASMYAYEEHRGCARRRSPFVRGTACYAMMPDEMRITVTAAPRANMSTAVLERRPAKRTRGRERPGA